MSVLVYDAIVVGAGSSGLTAAYEMKRRGVNLRVLEANDRFGGRVDKVPMESFPGVDINLDKGAYIVHNGTERLEYLIDTLNLNVDFATEIWPKLIEFSDVPYSEYYFRTNEWMTYGSNFEDDGEYREYVWKNYTWYQFFQDYIHPPIADDITYGCAVNSIDYSNKDAPVSLSCSDGRVFQAQQVLVTASVGVMKANTITFVPALPTIHAMAFQDIPFVSAMKMWIEFDTKFWDQNPSFSVYEDNRNIWEFRWFWDASYMEDSEHHVLGVLWNHRGANARDGTPEADLLQIVLNALDTAFGNNDMNTNMIASTAYIQHFFKNWTDDEFARGGWSDWDRLPNLAFEAFYLAALALNPLKTDDDPMGRVYFAGEHIVNDAWYGIVDGAAISGQSIACYMLGGVWDDPEFEPCVFTRPIVTDDTDGGGNDAIPTPSPTPGRTLPPNTRVGRYKDSKLSKLRSDNNRGRRRRRRRRQLLKR